jgi:hypothetical protein
MNGRRRALILAALALAVPLPALALTGGSGSGLAVQASLGTCGVAGGSITCSIEAGFSGIPEARYITASVTAPDGSVTDFGNVVRCSSGSATLWVPYTGSGTYTVSASAWGIDDEGDLEVIDTEKAQGGDGPRVKEVGTKGGPRSGAIVPPEGETAPTNPATEEGPEAGLPPCEPEPAPVPEPPSPEDPAGPGEVPDEGAPVPDQGAPEPDAVDPAQTESAPSTEATAPDCAPPKATAPPGP